MNARDLARRVLARVEEGAYATLALDGELKRARGLSDPDRGLTTELVYGVLKQRRRLDAALAAYAPRGIDGLDDRTLDALRIGAYQILFLRVPDHASVDDAVEAVKHARGSKLAGFANALLRRLAREGEPEPKSPGVRGSAPDWLVAEAQRRFPAEVEPFLDALNTPAPLWLRANTLRTSREQVMARLAEERPSARVSPSERTPEALRVEGAGELAATRVFAEGLVSAQDLGAQLVARLVDPQPGERILDACAGVGGKSAHLAALSGGKAAIDSADLSERKLELCMDSARRLGVSSLSPIVCDLADANAPLQPSYQRVLLDAPCSGLGVLRRHPEAKWRERPDAVELAALQKQMLDALAPRAARVLVYSVCTFTDEEGPRQRDAFLAAHPEFRATAELATWPHRDDADAFFAVRFERIG
jgi:16S rRNA (cytosine967-C5)-methyltransferase